MMIKQRMGVALSIAAAAFALVPGMLAMPMASADALPNGLTVDCSQDSDIHATCIVGGCPRVNGDYVVDAMHYRYDSGGSQQEVDFKCINGQTARVGLDTTFQSGFGVQACRKKDLEGDWCTPFAHVDYTPPAKAAPPVAAPVDTPVAVTPPTVCPAGSTTPTVPAGQTCVAIPPPSTNSVTMSASGAGLGKVNVTFNNSSDIVATCQYTAAPSSNPLGILPTINKTVKVNPKGTGSLNGEQAPPPLTSYHLSADCTGIFNGQEVPLGSPQTDVSG